MKVNKVFCYSKEVASKHGNRLFPIILAIVLSFILFIVGFMLIFEYWLANTYLVLLLTNVFIIAIGFCCVLLGLKLQSKLMGWAITTDNRLFRTRILSYGSGLYLGGVAVGSLVDNITKNNNNGGRTLGGILGLASETYFFNKSAEYARNPNVIVKIVEDYSNVRGAEVIEILKVHSLIEERKKFKMVCDIKYLNSNKIKFNKKITIEKSFLQLDDLINSLKTHIIN